MKAPALRVIKAKIGSKWRDEISAYHKELGPAIEQYHKDRVEHSRIVNDLITAEANRNPKKYATFHQSNGSIRWLATPAFDEMCQDIRSKMVPPKEPVSGGTVSMFCASLDIRIEVPKARSALWVKFVNECDDAFLNDDAKKILEALAALG